MFAKAHSVIANADLNILVPRLKQLAKQQDARLIVLGMPYAIDGSDTPKTLETKAFMKNLQELLDIPVISFDERYSSAEAEAELKKIGKSWQEARKMVDAMAAAMILKSYLESENR